MNPTLQQSVDINLGIDLNNRAYSAAEQGRHQEAIEYYKKAVEIKARAFGAITVHVCISLSGLSDSYLALKDYDNAFKEADRMRKIAERIKDPEQMRIAKLILADIAKARQK